MEISFDFDVADLDVMERFWAAALGYESAGAIGQYRSLRPVDGIGPQLILQQVPEPKTAKNRLHLDLDHEAGFDVEAEAARLVALGAVRHSQSVVREFPGMEWIVMADPEGNEFCICAGG
jgi:hypothetical protein